MVEFCKGILNFFFFPFQQIFVDSIFCYVLLIYLCMFVVVLFVKFMRSIA